MLRSTSGTRRGLTALALCLALSFGCRARDKTRTPDDATASPAGAAKDSSRPGDVEGDVTPAPPGWRRYTSRAHHFSALLPVEGELLVESAREEAPASAGLVADAGAGESVRVELPNGSYHVSVLKDQVGLDPTDNIAAFFEERIQWFVQSSGGELIAERRLLHRGYHGVGADVRLPLGDQRFGAIHLRIIRAGVYHYELVVISPEPNSARAEAFFEGFELSPALDREVYGQYAVGQRDLVFAELHRRRREPAVAAGHFERAAASGAYNGRILGAIHLARADVLDQMGDTEGALAAYADAEANDVAPPYVAVRRAAMLLALGRAPEADAVTSTFLSPAETTSPASIQVALDPELSAEAYRLRGVARYAQAYAAAPASASADASSRPAAPASAPRKPLTPARADLDEAAAMEPTSVRGRAWRGLVRYEQGEREAARDDLLRAASLAPTDIGQYCGLLWRVAGRSIRAQALELATWLEEHPEPELERHAHRHFVHRALLAELWLLAGDRPRADAAYARARALRTEDPELIHRHGGLKDVMGRPVEAAADYALAHELAPDNLRYRNSLAWTLATSLRAELRDGARAVEVARPVLEGQRDPAAGQVDTLAAAYAEAGRWDEAVATQKRALAIARGKGAGEREQADFKKRLAAYEARKPWREDPAAVAREAEADAEP